ncbi:hypothetical protein ASPZODRAFT_143860 [Penicilliopsis zonata CBS 506.65]|uniref:NACHT domain-containing protein n=1 Tax=Penicilliopsis zonata CBS 506.65 TaxID=1073090 RepID=A0A1L9SDJ6_9EURO|nr:hypothetical protein ASPZODRAFT_143860 [Penicilliopsis zonata CBS 506.65]OJJ45212.1 hypothetical protein ASPZODRAFT_143860 [Penicilliopsis zonata CBS 506.65]
MSGKKSKGFRARFRNHLHPRHGTPTDDKGLRADQGGSGSTSPAASVNQIHSPLPKTQQKRQPPNLWQAAFEKLEGKQKNILMPNASNSTTSDIKSALNDIIETVNQQSEIRKLKREDKWFGDGPEKVLRAVLALQANISAVVACDPTGHASSAWAAVSFGLMITQNYRQEHAAWFESSKFLSDTISRMTLIEISYRDGHPAATDGLEDALTQTYLEILRYSAEVIAIQKSNKGVRILKSITAMTDLPLASIKKSIESEELRLDKWVKVQDQIRWNEKADRMLAQSSEILSVVRNMDQTIALSGLPMVHRAVFDTYTPDVEDECLPDTRVELRQTIADWIDDPNGKALFWLNGLAGTGKSTIARTVAREMKERGLLGATFFFNRSEADRSSLKYFFPTVARQLADAVPDLRESIANAAEFAQSSIHIQFKEIILGPLSKIKTKNGQNLLLILVIDAVDECHDENHIPVLIQLLSQLQKTNSSIELRAFVTSRPELPLNIGFIKIPDEHQKAILHDIQESSIEHDLLIFFKEKLSKIRHERDEEEDLEQDWPGADIIQILVAMAMPLFIFAATVCRELQDPQWPAKDILNGILEHQNETSKLVGTYLPVLNRLLLSQKEERRKIELVQQIQHVLGAIVILEDTLPVKPLAKLIDVWCAT